MGAAWAAVAAAAATGRRPVLATSTGAPPAANQFMSTPAQRLPRSGKGEGGALARCSGLQGLIERQTNVPPTAERRSGRGRARWRHVGQRQHAPQEEMSSEWLHIPAVGPDQHHPEAVAGRGAPPSTRTETVSVRNSSASPAHLWARRGALGRLIGRQASLARPEGCQPRAAPSSGRRQQAAAAAPPGLRLARLAAQQHDVRGEDQEVARGGQLDMERRCGGALGGCSCSAWWRPACAPAIHASCLFHLPAPYFRTSQAMMCAASAACRLMAARLTASCSPPPAPCNALLAAAPGAGTSATCLQPAAACPSPPRAASSAPLLLTAAAADTGCREIPRRRLTSSLGHLHPRLPPAVHQQARTLLVPLFVPAVLPLPIAALPPAPHAWCEAPARHLLRRVGRCCCCCVRAGARIPPTPPNPPAPLCCPSAGGCRARRNRSAPFAGGSGSSSKPWWAEKRATADCRRPCQQPWEGRGCRSGWVLQPARPCPPCPS